MLDSHCHVSLLSLSPHWHASIFHMLYSPQDTKETSAASRRLHFKEIKGIDECVCDFVSSAFGPKPLAQTRSARLRHFPSTRAITLPIKCLPSTASSSPLPTGFLSQCWGAVLPSSSTLPAFQRRPTSSRSILCAPSSAQLLPWTVAVCASCAAVCFSLLILLRPR